MRLRHLSVVLSLALLLGVSAAASGPGEGLRVEVAAGPKGAVYLLAAGDGDLAGGERAASSRLWVSGDHGEPFREVTGADRGQPLGPDARLAVASDGTAYVLHRTAGGVSFAWSRDGGETWRAMNPSPPILFPEGAGEVAFAVGADGRMAVVWLEAYEAEPPGTQRGWRAPDPQLWVTVSEDGGRTFLDGQRQPLVSGTILGGVAYAPDGTLLIASAVSESEVQVRTGTVTGDDLFLGESMVVARGRVTGAPALTISEDGRAHLAWAETSMAGGSLHVAVRDAGAPVWSAPGEVMAFDGAVDDVAATLDGQGALVLAATLADAASPAVVTVPDPLGAPGDATVTRAAALGNLDADLCAVAGCEWEERTRTALATAPNGCVTTAWTLDASHVAFGGPGRDVTHAEPAMTPLPEVPASSPESLWRQAAVVGGAVAGVAALGFALHQRVGPALVGLYSRIADEEALDHPTRRALRDLVAAEPGIHFRALARALDLSHGNLEHHLRVLARADIIKEIETANHRCFFLPDECSRDVARALTALRSDGARAVLSAARAAGPVSLSAVATRARVAVSTAHHHVRHLERAGLLRAISRGHTRTVDVTELGRRVLATLDEA